MKLFMILLLALALALPVGVFAGGQQVDSLIARTVRVTSAPAASTWSDSFVVMKKGVLARRNRAQVLTDIGALPLHGTADSSLGSSRLGGTLTKAGLEDSLSRKAPRCSIAVNSYVKSIHATSGKQGAGIINDNGEHSFVYSTPLVGGGLRGSMLFLDLAPYGIGVGGGVVFGGKFNSSGGSAYFAGIKGVKANATDANASGQLHFQTRLGAANPSTRMVIDENGKGGIGTLTPDSLWSVAGGGHFTGGLKVDGKLTATADSSLGSSRLGGLDKSAFALTAHLLTSHPDWSTYFDQSYLTTSSPTFAGLTALTGADAAMLRILQVKNNGGSAAVCEISDDRGFSGVTTGPNLLLKAYRGGDESYTANKSVFAVKVLNLDGLYTTYFDINTWTGNVTAPLINNGTPWTTANLTPAAIGAEPAFSKNAGFNPMQSVNSTASPTFAGVTVGSAFFGESSYFPNHAYFGRSDHNTQFNFGFIQRPDGSTCMNAPAGQAVNFMNNGVKIADITANGLNLGGSQPPYIAQDNNGSITWGILLDAPNQYSIRTQVRSYTNALGVNHPDYTKLQLNWSTGIEIGASKMYGGTRFYNGAPAEDGTQIMSIGDGDDNIRIENDLYVKHDKLVWHTGNLTPAAIGAAEVGHNHIDTGSFVALVEFGNHEKFSIPADYCKYSINGTMCQITFKFPYNVQRADHEWRFDVVGSDSSNGLLHIIEIGGIPGKCGPAGDPHIMTTMQARSYLHDWHDGVYHDVLEPTTCMIRTFTTQLASIIPYAPWKMIQLVSQTITYSLQ